MSQLNMGTLLNMGMRWCRRWASYTMAVAVVVVEIEVM